VLGVKPNTCSQVNKFLFKKQICVVENVEYFKAKLAGASSNVCLEVLLQLVLCLNTLPLG
jgi:hypothetical protein